MKGGISGASRIKKEKPIPARALLAGKGRNRSILPFSLPSSPSPAKRTENLLQQARTGADRVFTDGFFLFGDHQEQAVHRLVRDIAVKIGVLLVEQAEFGGFPGVLIVLPGQIDLGGCLLDDRQEFGGDVV